MKNMSNNKKSEHIINKRKEDGIWESLRKDNSKVLLLCLADHNDKT